ncbi:MAG: hypothetical protein DI598_08180 [Pseudopedobacter saltans]|uniref:Uncharacterized protein n=1 Tax=Pseudopedobacter saltans TaxID=151895 RepID=A0A2W5EZA3_9SPHI|nr:MAG: hypothetical protein DI598_08180 [Pseudopedobacter saltans]
MYAQKKDSIFHAKYDVYIFQGDSLKNLGLLDKSVVPYTSAMELYKKTYPKTHFCNEAYKLAQVYGLLNNFDSTDKYLRFSTFYDTSSFKFDTSFYQFSPSQKRKLKDNIVYINKTIKQEWKTEILDFDLPKIANNLTLHLTEQLDSLQQEDQKYRLLYQHMDNKADATFLKKAIETDSSNVRFAKKIISQYGWPSSAMIDVKVKSALFLVFQHASEKTQSEYYSVLKQAYEEGKLAPPDFALFEDRVSTFKNGYQIYGSQIEVDINGKKRIYPIKDEKTVDERRKKMWLPPLEDYAKEMNIEYKKADKLSP